MSIPTLPRPWAPPPRETGAHIAPPHRTPARLMRGRPGDPVWARPAALTLLLSTAVLYLWNLSASGWANSYYASAVQAGTQSWKAFLFGSLDAGNIITVDKTPASLWVMELSGRVFGFSSWSMLAPQALEGVAAVGLLYLAVRRVSGPAAGLVAGASLALTPVAALMFRFNNPDALLVLLLVASALCTVRALERATDRAGTRWLMLAGVCLGLGFLTKMLQAFLVLPALGVVFLLFAAGPVRRRIGQLLLAGLAMVAAAGWWIALVQLWPASSRPYIGGSTNNSVLELALGYNGLSRILGNTGGGPGGGGGVGSNGNTGFGGTSGLLRMFGDSFGTEVSWLLPAALLGLALTLWTTRRAARTDLTRASAVLWGLWMLVTAAVFSFMSGTVHPYYAVALAPAIAALVATGGREAWRHRDRLVARIGLASMVASTGLWGIVLLARTADWHPELRYALVPFTVVATVAVLLTGARARARLAGATLVAALLTGLGGTGAFAVQTAALAHSGSIPTSGPSTSAMGGAMRPGGMPSGTGQQRTGTLPGGGGQSPDESTSDSAVVSLLRTSTTTWAAAPTGAQSAASLELSSGTSVIGIGGFTGSDPAPTLARFKALVAAGQVHYFVVSGGSGSGGSGPGGSGPGSGSGSGSRSRSGSTIQEWVAATFTATTVGNATVYDLTSTTTS